MRRGAIRNLCRLAVAGVALLGCAGPPEPYVPTPPSPVIQPEMGWRHVATWPDQDDPTGGYFPYSFSPNGATFLGEVGDRLHVRAVVTEPEGTSGPPVWSSIDEAGRTPVRTPGTLFGVEPAQVLDDETHFYAWVGDTLHRRRWVEGDAGVSMLDELVFDGEGVMPSTDPGLTPVGLANRALDLTIVNRYWNQQEPMLFARGGGEAAGFNYLVSHRELVLDRHLKSSELYGGEDGVPGVFDPPDGPPYVIEVGVYRGARAMLQVFATTEDASDRDPEARVLRRAHAIPVALGSSSRVLQTPHTAWALVTDASTWSLYAFDRATERLSLAWTMEAPLDLTSGELVDPVATDDGTVYVALRGREGTTRVLRLVSGVATDLWSPELATESDFRFDALYSNGARVFGLVSSSYPMTFSARGGQGPMTFSRPRFSVITPDIADVPTPALGTPTPFVPPPSCNPVTNEGCASGEACDAGPSRNGFTCHPAGATALCAPCDPVDGPQCAPGLTCFAADDSTAGVCVRLCCATEDCGAIGAAVCTQPASAFAPGRLPVGICQSTERVDIFVPACTGIPETGPSAGACSALP